MGRENHISSLRIQNFKCFEDFTMDNIGQFNLIVGANNTGKTSLLEALLMNQGNGDEFLYDSLVARIGNGKEQLWKQFDFITRQKNDKHLEEKIQFEAIVADDDKQVYTLDSLDINQIRQKKDLYEWLLKLYGESVATSSSKQRWIARTHFDGRMEEKFQNSFGLTRFDEMEPSEKRSLRSPFIRSSQLYGAELTELFSLIQKSKEAEKKFIESLSVIVPTIDQIRIDLDEGVMIWLNESDGKPQNAPIPLYMFGEGTVRLFRILAKLFVSDLLDGSQILIIDEVDFGIHDGALPKFWEQLILLAKQADIQLFMTTHSFRSVEAFWNTFNSLKIIEHGIDSSSARHFILQRDKDGIPRSYSLPHSHLGHAIENDNNFMGYS